MTTTTALTMVETAGPEWTGDEINLIKRTIAPGIGDMELKLFLYVCKQTSLNPLMRQIYTIKRGDKWTIQTGIDGYRLLAARTGQLAGIDEAQYDTESEPHPNKASVTVWRMVAGQRCPFTATARWSEYHPERGGGMWERMPYLMLGKCAESLALRKAFPAELSGVYTAEEMAQADTPVVEAITEAAPSTARQLGAYATKHGIAPRMIQAGLRKYGGDIERTYEAMRTFVQNRDAAKKPTKPAPVLDDEIDVTFEVEDTRDHSLEGLEVAGKN